MAQRSHLSPMALSAQLRTFSPKTPAAGTPESEGLHWTLPANRFDFTLPANRLDFVIRIVLALFLTGW